MELNEKNQAAHCLGSVKKFPTFKAGIKAGDQILAMM